MDDAIIAALAASLCDVVAAQIIEMRAALMLLEKKGLLSSAEYLQAKSSIPLEAVREISQQLQREVQTRISARILDLKRDQGPVH